MFDLLLKPFFGKSAKSNAHAPEAVMPPENFVPTIVVHEPGITAELIRRSEHVRWLKEEDGRVKGPRDNKGHFAVSLRSDGTNPDYPEGSVDRTIYLMNDIEDSEFSTWSRADDFLSISKSSRYTEIVIRERFYENPKKSNGIFWGRVPEIEYPLHSILTVTAYAMVPGKGTIEIRGPELAVRKSDKESPAFQRAANSPHYMLEIS